MMLLFSMGTALRQVFLFLVIGVLTQLFPFMQASYSRINLLSWEELMPSWHCYFRLEINHLVHNLIFGIGTFTQPFHLCRPVTLTSALLHSVQHLPSCRSQSCLEKTCRYDSRQSSGTTQVLYILIFGIGCWLSFFHSCRQATLA